VDPSSSEGLYFRCSQQEGYYPTHASTRIIIREHPGFAHRWRGMKAEHAQARGELEEKPDRDTEQ